MLVLYAVMAGLIILVVRYPRQVIQSLRRWGQDDMAPPPRTGPASATFSTVAARMRRLAKTTLLLTPTKSPAFSKLGGDPELSADLSWPAGYEQPRTFVAQIDLAELPPAPAVDWLPTDGRVYAFYDPDGHGAADVVRILYSTQPAIAQTPAPQGVKSRFPERRVSFLPLTSIPSLDWLGVDVREIDVSHDELDQLATMPEEPFGDELQHRIGGYPSEIQETQMALECENLARGLPAVDWSEEVPPAISRAAKEWRLLLQIDSDPALKMNFGDGGRLYVFIRERHARVGNFAQTVTLSQSS